MSVKERFAVYGFATTHDALTAEATLECGAVAVAAIPAPRELGSFCGLALRVRATDADAAEAVMGDAGLAWTGRIEIEDRVPRW